MMREKQYDEAIGFYSRALDVDPTFDFAYYNRGLCRFYCNDEDGLADLIQAARLNCEFAPLYEALCRYGISILGFEAIANLITNEDLPANAKEDLSRELCTKLLNVHYLLNSRKLEENQPDEGTLIRFCQIADAATTGGRQQTSAERCLLLRHVLAEAQHTSDTEVEWRAWYLLGVMAYWPITSSGFPPHLPYDMPEIFPPLAWADKKTASVLIELAKEKNVELPDGSELVRMASVARHCFHQASSILCVQFDEPQLLKREDAEKAWYICEDVFRELGRCCVFLDSTKGLIDAIERARFCYHMNWTHTLNANNKSCRKRIRDHYGSVTDDQLKNALGKDGLILDYYIGEIVEDRLLIAAATQTSNTVTEVDITVISPSDKKAGQSLLSAFLEANEHWVPRETRISQLKKSEEVFKKKGHKEPLIAILSRFDFSDFPDSIEPRMEKILLDPVREEVSHCRHLAIAPFNYLNNFPFHALPMIEKALQSGRIRSIVYTPSIKLLCDSQDAKASTKNESRFSCLFIGYDNTNRLAIDRELEVVKNAFERVNTLVGNEATPTNVLSMMAEFDALHFCCHGNFDTESESPYLDLAGGKLFPTDILLGKSVPPLVFSNACISATGPRQSRNGDQTMGLHTAFLLSGAKGVIGTLWKVHDDVAVDFAGDFYLRWTRDIETSTPEIFTASQQVIRKRYPKLGMWAPYAFFGVMIASH